MKPSTLIADYSWFYDASGQWLPEEEQLCLDLADGDVDSASKFWASVLARGGPGPCDVRSSSSPTAARTACL